MCIFPRTIEQGLIKNLDRVNIMYGFYLLLSLLF